MKPEWVMVGIAAAGLIFQAGIGWALLDMVRRRLSEHDRTLDEHHRRLEDHHLRIRLLEREG